VQRLRANIYCYDGALRTSDLSTGGLHCSPEDDRAWHLLMTNKEGRITACVRCVAHDGIPSREKLCVRNSPPALRRDCQEIFWRAVESDLDLARREKLRYVEIGGWAVTREARHTTEGLVLALASFSFGRMFGGALGMTTATVRHASSTILRRLGGSHLAVGNAVVAPYYDPSYGCQMEVLRFDSREPNMKYSGVIDMLKERLASVLVIAQTATVKRLPVMQVGRISAAIERDRATA
jgi:hypothetical protein